MNHFVVAGKDDAQFTEKPWLMFKTCAKRVPSQYRER
jgi:hypothetical protein